MLIRKNLGFASRIVQFIDDRNCKRDLIVALIMVLNEPKRRGRTQKTGIFILELFPIIPCFPISPFTKLTSEVAKCHLSIKGLENKMILNNNVGTYIDLYERLWNILLHDKLGRFFIEKYNIASITSNFLFNTHL